MLQDAKHNSDQAGLGTAVELGNDERMIRMKLDNIGVVTSSIKMYTSKRDTISPIGNYQLIVSVDVRTIEDKFAEGRQALRQLPNCLRARALGESTYILDMQ